MKKTLALLLSLLMLVCALPLTAAAADKTCDCDKAPRIYVDGINCCALLRDYGTEAQKDAFSLAPEAIIGLLKDNKEALFDVIDGRFSSGNEAQLVNAIISMFADCSMNPDGTSKYDIKPGWSYATDDRHRSGNVYEFKYDWRLDPFVIAEQLHDYVEYVKELTGHDTVHLAAHSLGTCVMNTYFTLYGYEGIESVVWYCGAYRGVDLVCQIFTGKLRLDADAVTGFLHENTENSTLFNAVSALLQGLTDIGITGGVMSGLNKFLEKACEDDAFAKILRETFGAMPTLWTFIDDENYEAAKNFVFPTDAEKETYAGLIEKIDRYHYDVQAHADEIMEAARAATGKIGVISKYNRHATPVVANGSVSTDSIIDGRHTSGGATFAELGKTLGEDYVQAVQDGHNHLSADGKVDASTCRYPEYTWFIRDMEHSQGSDYVDALLSFIAFSDHQVTVSENPDFPQFSLFNRNTGETTPLTAEDDAGVNKKTVQRFKDFLQKILDFFRKLFTGALFKK